MKKCWLISVHILPSPYELMQSTLLLWAEVIVSLLRSLGGHWGLWIRCSCAIKIYSHGTKKWFWKKRKRKSAKKLTVARYNATVVCQQALLLFELGEQMGSHGTTDYFATGLTLTLWLRWKTGNLQLHWAIQMKFVSEDEQAFAKLFWSHIDCKLSGIYCVLNGKAGFPKTGPVI